MFKDPGNGLKDAKKVCCDENTDFSQQHKTKHEKIEFYFKCKKCENQACDCSDLTHVIITSLAGYLAPNIITYSPSSSYRLGD